MRKKHIKFISVLCAIVLAFGLIYSPHFKSRAEEGISFSDVVKDGFHCVTLSDFGVEDTDKTDGSVDFYMSEDKDNVKSLHKTAFRAYTVFNNKTGAGTEFHLFTQKGGNTGIAFTIGSKNGKDLQLKRIKTPGPSISPTFTATVSKAGIDATTFNGTYFLLGLTVEFVDSDSDGDDDDMKLGVFFNDKLYDDSYITIRNAASSSSYKMGARMNFAGESGEIYSYVEPKKISECPENDYDRLTLSDFGISSGSTEGKSGKLSIESLDRKLFNISAVFKGDETSGTVMRLGATSETSGDGVAVYSKGSNDPNLYLSVSGKEIPLLLRKTNIGTTTSLDVKFDLYISTENIDGKLKLGIFINDDLYNGEYFTFENFESLGEFLVFEGKAGEAYSILPPITLQNSDSADFTLITLSDLGIVDGNSNTKGYYGQSFDKTVLGFNVKFTGEGARLHYANNSSSSYSGLGIRLEGKNLVVSCEAGSADQKLIFDPFTITPDDARTKFKTFANNEFLLHISCEFGDFGGDNNKKDVKIGIFINELLYKSEYLYINDCADRMHDNFNFAENGAKSYSSIETAPKAFPEHLKKITFTDAGLGTGSGAVSGKFQTVKSLDGTIFGANIKFSKNSSRMHIGFTDNSYGGFGVRLEDGKIVVGNELGNKEGALSNIGVSAVKVDPVKAGVGDTFVDKEFLLQLSIEFVDQQNDGNKNDIKFGVFINGTLYSNAYFYVKDQADLLGLGLNFNEGGAAFYSPYVSEPVNNVPDQLNNLTLSDARIGIGGGNRKGKFVRLNSLDGTYFRAKLKFNKNGSRMHIGLKEDGYAGIGIRLEDGNMVIGNELGNKEGALSNIGLSFIKIYPDIAGVGDTFVDKEFVLGLSTEYVDKIGDGTADDVRLGVFINGKCYQNTYFYIYGQADRLGTGINFNEGGAAYAEPYGDTIPAGSKSYKELTERDFMISARKYKKCSITSVYDYASLDKTAVTLKLKFSKDSPEQCSVYFGPTWYGTRISTLEDGSLRLSHVHKDGTLTIIANISPKSVGLNSFLGTEFNLRLTYDIIKQSGGYIDYRLGAFVNGKPCGEKGAYILKCAEPETLRSAMFIYCGKKGSVTFGTKPSGVDFTIFGFEKATWKQALHIS